MILKEGDIVSVRSKGRFRFEGSGQHHEEKQVPYKPGQILLRQE